MPVPAPASTTTSPGETTARIARRKVVVRRMSLRQAYGANVADQISGAGSTMRSGLLAAGSGRGAHPQVDQRVLVERPPVVGAVLRHRFQPRLPEQQPQLVRI